MDKVRLIAAPLSLYCCRVEMALRFKAIEYEYIHEDVADKSPMLLELNPVHKKIPVLLHNGVPINESLLILEYLDETWKENPLLPKDPCERAQARFWANYADEKGEDKEKAIATAVESLAFIEELIKGKKFFGGESIGYMDLALGWIPLWTSVMEEVGDMKILDEETFPFLHEWAQSFIQVPLVKSSMPPREEFFNYVRSTAKYLRSLAAKKL
ncbi:hypothetical protein RJ640_003483 [Escallonia rubra]|uniref:glutathione transferase n=1 Tax=Escallonia rubra TaxID=112253 RepID=A0AA88QPQ6_9ASTE|nr:hypothetical protein RJ640_003483 [Escallonia rubra]